MDHEGDSQSNTRATLIVVMTLILFGVPCLGFLTFVTDGIVLIIPVGVGLLSIVGLAHYLLWGRSLSRQTEGEREEAEIREQTEEWDMPKPRETHRP
jgi:Ca2+/Na+ antiporter